MTFNPIISLQIEHDPRMPAYIATQGPLSHTIADFWQVRATPDRQQEVLSFRRSEAKCSILTGFHC